MTIHIDTDNLIRVNGLATEIDDVVINNATITVTLLDPTDTLVTGSTITLTSTGSGGNYSGTMPDTITITRGVVYSLKLVIVSGTLQRTIWEPTTAIRGTADVS